MRLIKLGYFKINPVEQDYWGFIDEIRAALDGWQRLGEKYNVKICYHTHSGDCMGLNCAALMHMIKGYDPRFIGAYIDPAHMAVNGEPFAFGVAMVKQYLSIVSVKDVLTVREEKEGHGASRREWVVAGEGVVDWTDIFSELKRVGFDGPTSIHCEFEVPPDQWLEAFTREVAFFRDQRARISAA
ncbi:MAG: sugar phosphate isomerase/epimerase [Anaerolineae bacterium]|nr:sugar phosphate isomerase/epimerase [Anaerolineae bacterium]